MGPNRVPCISPPPGSSHVLTTTCLPVEPEFDFICLRHRFVQLVRKYHPHSLLHFEDFGVNNAQRLLDIYRDKHAVFNDDV